MKLKFPLILLLAALIALPSLAQDSTANTVRFNDISFQFDPALGSSINIGQVPGDPTDSAGPGFSDAAKTQFTLYSFGEPTDSLFETGGVRVYQIADLAQYDFLMASVRQLETLLAERPDLAQFEPAITNPDVGGLPYVPVLTHGQVLTARAQYIETDSLQGISYVTSYMAALEPFTSTSFLYTFQGISSDGQHFIAVTFPLSTTLFPESLAAVTYDPEKFQEEWPQYQADSIATINDAPADAFTPSLELADALVQSIQFGAN